MKLRAIAGRQGSRWQTAAGGWVAPLAWLPAALAAGGWVAALAALAWLPAAGCAAEQPRKSQKMNVLFFLADDLRNELGCYGTKGIKTPNIDKLAAGGVRFDKAYCQVPLCNPSRTSLLTGQYPQHNGVFGNEGDFRALQPNVVTLPELFKNSGYATVFAGKIFHGGKEDMQSWNEGLIPPPVKVVPGYTGPKVYSAETSDVIGVMDDNQSHQDILSTKKTIEYLEKFKDRPFFVACGFIEPHSPFTAPQRFFDRYDPAKIELPPDFAPRPTVPAGFPKASLAPKNYDLFMGRDATPEEARKMIQAYWASTTWIDSEVGEILAALDRLGLRDKTIIVFWGDNGYHLGEKGKWSKHGSLWEPGARIPLIITAPGMPGNGKACPRVVETLDLYRTLADLCGLPAPATVDGRSLKPLLENPQLAWDHPAYTMTSPNSLAVRTEQWRYVEYGGNEAMLIDEQNDPHETKNLADDPKCAEARAKLHGMLEMLRAMKGPTAGGAGQAGEAKAAK